jgi:hypothetical protein
VCASYAINYGAGTGTIGFWVIIYDDDGLVLFKKKKTVKIVLVG